MRAKKVALALAAIALVIAVLFVCAKKTGQQDNTKRIGIISAMGNEVEMLLSESEIDHVDKIGDLEYHVGTLRGHPVVISKSGIGKVRASSGVTAMLNNYNIESVMFTGIAGGVADETEVLDVVIATKLVEHDYGRMTNEGLTWTSGDPGAGVQDGEYYIADPKLVDMAYEAASEVVGKEHAYKGVVATGDQFIASETYVKRLQDMYNAYACEMEGASLAVVCIKYDVPFIVIRTLSDKADGKAHESYANMGTIAAENSNKIILNMLEDME